MDLEEMGLRVRLALADLDLSMHAFAKSHGLSASYVSEVCRGRKKASLEIIEALVVSHGYSAEWLLGGIGPRRTVDAMKQSPRRGRLVSSLDGPPTEEQELELRARMLALYEPILQGLEALVVAARGVDGKDYRDLNGMLLTILARGRGSAAVSEVRAYLKGVIAGLPSEQRTEAKKPA